MRLSVREDDPGYRWDACFYSVLLNGKFLDHCHTADEEASVAFVYATDGKGRIKNQLVTIPVYGEVQILDEFRNRNYRQYLFNEAQLKKHNIARVH